MKIEPIQNSRLANTGKELRDLAASDADWIVRGPDDVKQLREAGGNAFAKLPEPDFLAFLASLQFNNSGVAGGCYRPLMSSLMLSEIFEVFAYFGMSAAMVAGQTEDESCQECKCNNGKCKHSFWDFCSSLCA